ncbi:MAG: DUF2752 domain-containing protein [Phycisphaerales bacterium JB037]
MAAVPPTLPAESLRLPRSPLGERLAWGVAAALCLTLLGVAAGLQPASEGMGTHTQLGFPDCSWPMVAGIPCPACGMTTSFALAADASLLESARTQPFAAILAILTATGVWFAGYAAVTGARIGGYLRELLAPRVMYGFVALLLVAWVYKIITFGGTAQ